MAPVPETRYASTEDGVSIAYQTVGDGPVDLAFSAGPGIHRLISGELTPDRAVASGAVELLRGRGELLGRFASTFHLAA